MMRSRKRMQSGKAVGWLILGGFVIIALFPLWIALKTAISPTQTIYATAGSLLPASVTLDNFARVLGVEDASGHVSTVNFALAMRNSIIFTLICVVGQMTSSALAAYGFARLRFVGRDMVFYLFLCATMVPAIVLFIPNFVLMKEIGWLNTFQGMAAPSILMTPFAIFFLRQFFLTTPRELEEAAHMDGASAFRIFWSVVLPVHRSAIATLATLLSINAWNDFFWPFLVGRGESVRVVAVALTNFQQQQPSGNPDWVGLMSATVLSIVPVIVLLVLFGRNIVESLQFSGLK